MKTALLLCILTFSISVMAKSEYVEKRTALFAKMIEAKKLFDKNLLIIANQDKSERGDLVLAESNVYKKKIEAIKKEENVLLETYHAIATEDEKAAIRAESAKWDAVRSNLTAWKKTGVK